MKTFRFVAVAQNTVDGVAPALCVIGLAALLGVGCHSSTPPRDAADPVGLYTLQSIDGTNVPTTLAHDGVAVRVLEGSLTFDEAGLCQSRTVFVGPKGREVTREVQATCSRHGSQVEMNWKGAGRTVGRLAGDTFVMTNEGRAFAYRKPDVSK